MNLNLIKTFVKVADCGSLTKASQLLNQPKSKISRDLVKLEDELEQTLLKRTHRGVSLTEYGFQFLLTTKDKIEDLENSILKLKHDPHQIKGCIKISASEDFISHVLNKLIFNFFQLYPDVSIELYSSTDFLDFKKNNIDLALELENLKTQT